MGAQSAPIRSAARRWNDEEPGALWEWSEWGDFPSPDNGGAAVGYCHGRRNLEALTERGLPRDDVSAAQQSSLGND